MVRNLLTLAIALCLAASARGQQTSAAGNALGSSASRYLRDAAASQIAWRPWGQAAFDAAKKAGRPIFLSIGFASSWDSFRLHQEVFNNAEIADSLNGYFIPVLVDRFEHPEVAEAFDTLQKSMSGTTTIPSSFILTPSLEPFAVAGLMAPREFAVVLATSASRWANQREAAEAEARANLVKAHLLGEQRAPGDVDASVLKAVVENVAGAFDPKLPRPATVSFALRYANATDNNAVRAAALESLRTIARLPVRDQVGGGFHRAPGVFEKTLADQALMAMAYLEAWQFTRDAEFETVVRTTLNYVIRDILRPKGAFLAAQDAHSLVPGQGPEFVNGVFYLWTKDEIVELVGRDAAAKVFRAYGITESAGNVPSGAERIDPDLQPVLDKLLEYRQKRPEPFREFSELAGWNGLTISALSRAGAVLGEQRYVDAAKLAANTIVTRLWNDKKKTLYRSDAATAAVIEATSEDYAQLVQGLLDLFESTSDVKWLELAKTLQQRQDALFWNTNTGRYATGSSLPESLRGLLVESDDVTPSVNGTAAANLLRLAMLTGNETWRARPNMIFQSYGSRLRNHGAQLPALASALSMSYATPRVVIVTGDPRSKAVLDLRRSIHERWEPLRAVVFVPEKGSERARITAALPFTAVPPDPEQPLTYVCEKGECRKR